MASKIFISYRRKDSAAAAGRLYDFLETKVGREKLFTDVDDLPYGKDFREEIRRAIDESRVVLVVIGSYFITEEKRLFRENDYVRYEIDYALKTGKRVIPVRVNEARMPIANQLPKGISVFSVLNGPELRNERWKDDCENLWSKIKPLINDTPSTSGDTFKPETGTYVDPRDKQVYKTVKLIGETWLAENLNFDAGKGCWYYDNDPSNGQEYGCLYTLGAATKACPPGWRLPTDDEWKKLFTEFGGFQDLKGNRLRMGFRAGFGIGKVGRPEQSFDALIEGGLSRLNLNLGGKRYADQGFNDIGSWGHYLSATSYNYNDVWTYRLSPDNFIWRSALPKFDGYSCRCVQEP